MYTSPQKLTASSRARARVLHKAASAKNGVGSSLQKTILWLLFAWVAPIPSAGASDAFDSGYAIGHDGSKIYYEVHGSGSQFVLFGFPMQPKDPSAQEFIDGLGRDYRLVFFEYPGEPKLYTLTPGVVARDYLEVANAVGAEKFAYYGYSWGAVCGLQLAIRTDRLTAFIAGGFPMIHGPYKQMLSTLRAMVAGDPSSTLTPEYARQVLTYYEGLQSFDDQSIQSKLRMPRLNFVGTNDRLMFPGNIEIEFFKIFDQSRAELKAAGWDVISVPDADHRMAFKPSIVTPLVREWLQKRWPARQELNSHQPRSQQLRNGSIRQAGVGDQLR